MVGKSKTIDFYQVSKFNQISKFTKFTKLSFSNLANLKLGKLRISQFIKVSKCYTKFSIVSKSKKLKNWVKFSTVS